MDISEITEAARTLPPLEHQAHSATGLPLRAIETARYAQAEDRAIWTSGWVCLGNAATIPAKGDILPYTLGNQGIHVQRLGNGELAARFNKVPHGGCRFVPLQCQTGAKTKCTFTACGYSRDRGVLNEHDDAAHQYLGLRPEKLLHIPLKTAGKLIFVNLGEVTEFREIPPIHGDFQNEVWAEYSENWKELPARLFGQAEAESDQDQLTARIELQGENLTLHWAFPNLIIIRAKNSECAIIVQPTALRLTMARISGFGAPRDWHQTIRKLLAQDINPQTDAAQFLRAMVNARMDESFP